MLSDDDFSLFTSDDMLTFAKHYYTEYLDLLECVHTAIKAGDWVVDGACDPERHLSKYFEQNKEEF